MILNQDSVGLIGRQKNVVELKYNKSILISSDILKTDAPSMTLDAQEETLELLAKDILLYGADNNNDPYSVVYGERLVEVLTFILKTLKEHSHPPNNIPINTFFEKADYWIDNMDPYLLNKRVVSR